jgi:NTP pyrophosphatase (non-canonical NTP hydrolase)
VDFDNPYVEELLTCLMEECSEVIKDVCKGLRFGFEEDPEYTGQPAVKDRLTSELGDVMGVVALLVAAGFDDSKIIAAGESKIERLQSTLKHNPDGTLRNAAN